jgi:hypothetical protein
MGREGVFASFRDALVQLEAEGERRAAQHYGMSEFRAHSQGHAFATEARRIGRAIDRLEKMRDAWA